MDLRWIENRVKWVLYIYIYVCIFIFIYILRFYPIFFYEQWEGREAYHFHFLRFAFLFFYCFVTVQFIYTHHENKMTKTLVHHRFLVYSILASDGRENSKVNPSPPTVPTAYVNLYVRVLAGPFDCKLIVRVCYSLYYTQNVDKLFNNQLRCSTLKYNMYYSPCTWYAHCARIQNQTFIL